MVIFRVYVNLPEGILQTPQTLFWERRRLRLLRLRPGLGRPRGSHRNSSAGVPDFTHVLAIFAQLILSVTNINWNTKYDRL